MKPIQKDNKRFLFSFPSKLWAIATLIVVLGACIDNFDPELTGDKASIVFEGTLTNQPAPHIFQLSFSAGYNSKESVFDRFVNAAKVWVTDEANKRTDLIDLNRGQFATPDGFRGQIGKSYQLHIRLSDGVEYESSPEMMRPAPPIDKVYTEFKPITTPKAQYRGMFNVYLDVKDPNTEGDFYRWNWKHYEKASYCEFWTQPNTVPPARWFKKCCEDCWNITPCLGCVNVASDNLVNGRTLAKQNVGQIPYDDTTPYYLLIDQMSLSRDAYNFWRSVDAQANNSGGIFDTAPAPIRGNIRNIKDAEDLVLGYFQVSAVTQKAVYIQRDNITVKPFSSGLGNFPFWPECIPCKEGPYRTGIRPLDWRD